MSRMGFVLSFYGDGTFDFTPVARKNENHPGVAESNDKHNPFYAGGLC
jgi:hypothetical protein